MADLDELVTELRIMIDGDLPPLEAATYPSDALRIRELIRQLDHSLRAGRLPTEYETAYLTRIKRAETDG